MKSVFKPLVFIGVIALSGCASVSVSSLQSLQLGMSGVQVEQRLGHPLSLMTEGNRTVRVYSIRDRPFGNGMYDCPSTYYVLSESDRVVGWMRDEQRFQADGQQYSQRLSALFGYMAAQQQTQAYRERTQVLAQPVRVNVSGSIQENVHVTGGIPVIQR